MVWVARRFLFGPPRWVAITIALLPCVVVALLRLPDDARAHASWLLVVLAVTSTLAVRVVLGRLDGDAAVAGVLLALTLRPETPLVTAAIGSVFGVLVARELFGDRGFVHPAVLGHVFLVLTWPTSVAAPTLVAGGGAIASSALVPCAVGAALLLAWQRLPWRVVTGVPIGLALGVAVLGGPSTSAVPVFSHLALGSLAFGTVFLAADAAIAPRLPSARWFFGALFGFLVVVFRLAKPGEPDGTVTALLLASVFAPLADVVAARGPAKREARHA